MQSMRNWTKWGLLALALAALPWVMAAARAETAPCDPAAACFDAALNPATLAGDFYLDGNLVAAGVNAARLTGAPLSAHTLEVRNIQDPATPGWNDLFVYPDQNRPNVLAGAGRIAAYRFSPLKTYVKGILEITCTPTGRKAADSVACRPTIDGVTQPDIAPNARAAYNLTPGAHAVHTDLVGDQANNWSPVSRDDTVTINAGRTYAQKTYLLARFIPKGLLKISLSAPGVVGDLYVDGVLIASQAAAAEMYVPAGAHTVEAKAITDPAANGQWNYPDAAVAPRAYAATTTTVRLRLKKNWLVGYLSVTCTIARKTATEDANCVVSSDGAQLGTVAAGQSAAFNLPPGPHAISAATGGAQAALWDGPVSRNVIIYGGQKSFFSARFNKKPQSAVAPVNTTPGVNHLGTPKMVIADYMLWYDPDDFDGTKTWDVPSAGPYNSDDFGTIQRQVAQAQQACLNGLAAHWYGPDNGRTTNNFNQLQAASAGTNLKNLIVIQTNILPGVSEQQIIDAINYVIGNWAYGGNYLQLGGKPVIIFTDMPRPWGSDAAALQGWARVRAATDPNHNTIWMAEGLYPTYNPLFDGLYVYRIDHRDFPQSWLKQKRWADGLRAVAARGNLPIGGLYFADTIGTGFDDTRAAAAGSDLRSPAPSFARDRRGGAYYTDTWNATATTGGDMLFVKSFNEWIEGTEIEPGTSYGDLYLNMTCQFANAYRSR